MAELDDETLAFAHRVFDLARDGDAGQLAELVDEGLPVDLTNAKGDTLLLLAAYYDRLDAVRVLVARGAGLDRANDRGQTPLAAAVFRQSRPAVELLLAAGADPLAGGPSAVDTARFFDLPELLTLLERPAGDR